jgi:hypothetical protein
MTTTTAMMNFRVMTSITGLWSFPGYLWFAVDAILKLKGVELGALLFRLKIQAR